MPFMKSLEEATRIKESVEVEWLRLPGVTGIDVAYSGQTGTEQSQPVIRVYVANLEDARRRSIVPSEIQGVPVVLIEKRFRLH
jgi:hypothetical protein